MRKITNIILHCSAGEWGCRKSITDDKVKIGYRDNPYHYLIINGFPTYNHWRHRNRMISLDGSVEVGRYLDDDTWINDMEIGAHTLGMNRESIGVCMIGVKNFTHKQIQARDLLLSELVSFYNLKVSNVLGHYETESGKKQNKTCPNQNMDDVRLRIVGDL